MGLDCYWTKPGESKSAPLDFDPPLCFEDEHDWQQRQEGWAHFEGRVFEHAIKDVTGVSLRASLDNRIVREMAENLARFAKAPWPLPPAEHHRGWHYFDTEVYTDLARLFKAYGEAGYELSGSW